LPYTEAIKKNQFWLIKTEPTSYAIDDLQKDKKTAWTGIRNYQVRNLIRDTIAVGDMCLFYHSSADPTGVVGIAKVVSKPYADPTAYAKKDHHFDPKSTKENPIWYAVDVSFVKKFKQIITLGELKSGKELDGMLVRSKGSRLSIQPVSEKHYKYIVEKLAA
jgi:predicted RNA-binding protein with PUA-like domain